MRYRRMQKKKKKKKEAHFNLALDLSLKYLSFFINALRFYIFIYLGEDLVI